MTHSMLRRQLKNLVQNFSEAEVKVREATSNDPWGPSSSQMADISDLTYNVVACNEILGMLWKRLNDDKNWRHVYKSLTLLEYLLKTGSERIPQQSVENIHIFKALTEYSFTDKDGKDQGVNVREKAKIVLVLIEDEEKRKEERDFAMKTKDKLTKAPSASSATGPDKEKAEIPPYTGLPSLDNIPSVADLTAAMAKKKEEQKRLEAERKEAERWAKEGDTEPDLWEKAATAEPPSNSDPWGAPSDASNESVPATNDPWGPPSDDSKESSLATNDPWGESADGTNGSAPASSDPWGRSASAKNDSPPASSDPCGGSTNVEKSSPSAARDPWGDSAGFSEDKAPSTNDPWGAPAEMAKDSDAAVSDPWGAPADSIQNSAPATSDPWGAPLEASSATSDPFGDGSKADNDHWGTAASSPPAATDPWGAPSAPTDYLFGNGGRPDPWGGSSENGDTATNTADETKKPASFLGEGASLVDLDSLMSVKPKPKQPPLNAIPTQKAPGFLSAAGMTRPLGGSISNAGGSTAQPSNPNYFGFNSMTPCSNGLSLNTAFGVPVAHMASPTQNTSHSVLTMSNMGFSMASPRMVQPSTAGTLIGELSPVSLTGTVTPQAPVLQQPPLVWGTGTGAAGKGNKIV
ncbi:epsin-1-like [Sinocyclocheilus anshuiensis]|uniref:epsin-1-like n=1 Tax=Sinocyclocheilus anshuiensis TaxID=1608454 RepID=UPI0007BA8CA1|nr:PREDICTED: epsin-1-like [Sinocyclocheilus anshuiensis]XP_016300004.1 PREDICTED: epsin-1-like [Sinocyclocheilus anshuiensis]XP_016300005.1 PREDICTED: epsin-1-like [Sinocyclocheilus anshuiensis]